MMISPLALSLIVCGALLVGAIAGAVGVWLVWLWVEGRGDKADEMGATVGTETTGAIHVIHWRGRDVGSRGW